MGERGGGWKSAMGGGMVEHSRGRGGVQEGGVVGKCTRLTVRVFFVAQHPPPSLPLFIFTPPPPPEQCCKS